MPRMLIDHDPLTGMSEYLHAGEGQFVIEHTQDVEPLLDANKRAATGDGPSTRLFYLDPDLHHVASIPDIVTLLWRSKYGVWLHDRDHWPAVRRLLNDPDWQYLKTIPGRI